MSTTPERLLAYILELGLDYRYDPDRDVLTVRTEKHSRHGRFYLAGGDDIVSLPRDVVFGDYEKARELIDTARQLSECFA